MQGSSTHTHVPSYLCAWSLTYNLSPYTVTVFLIGIVLEYLYGITQREINIDANT